MKHSITIQNIGYPEIDKVYVDRSVEWFLDDERSRADGFEGPAIRSAHLGMLVTVEVSS